VRSGCWRVDRALGLSGLDEVRRIEVPFNDVGEGGEVRLRGAFTRGYQAPTFETQGKQGSADANLRRRGVLGWMSATCGSNSELPLSNDCDDESFAQDAACAGAFV
jgi:hypothetical protein